MSKFKNENSYIFILLNRFKIMESKGQKKEQIQNQDLFDQNVNANLNYLISTNYSDICINKYVLFSIHVRKYF